MQETDEEGWDISRRRDRHGKGRVSGLQYYPPPQPMIPGYVQPMPLYHTPDQGQNRDLSPLFGNNVEQVEKRIRNNSADAS